MSLVPGTMLVMVLLAGCDDPASGPRAILDGDGFFDSPWPSDTRRTSDGRPDLTGFPNRDSIPLLDRWAAVAEGLDGFSTNAPVFFRFEGPLDEGLLPSPEASMEITSPLLLLNVDPDSPERGDLVPVQVDFQASSTEYQPENLLAMGPVYGFPLRPRTTYAALVRTPLASPAANWTEGFVLDDPTWGPTVDVLDWLGIAPESVAVGALFTTADPVSEMAEYAAYIRDHLSLPVLDQDLVLVASYATYDVYEGWTWLPLWQEGERPYPTEGGGLHRNESGGPQPFLWEYLHFSVTVPVGLPAPEAGWPVVLYSHGTGGDWLTYADPLFMSTVEAEALSPRGFLGIGIDLPLHGMRATSDTNVELHTFNYNNPDSSRANFRQGALDNVFLAETFTRRVATFQTPEHGEVSTDPTRVVFMGHSQGGIVGALAAPFMGDRVRAAFLSGAGGGIAMTLVYRKEGIDIAQILGALLGFDEDEEVDVMHPVVALLQWGVDVTDPLNYGPWWFAEGPHWRTSPLDVGMTEGLLDTYTPYQTTEALAAAGRVPILDPLESDSIAHRLRGLEEEVRPVSGNCQDWEGGRVTCGLAQYADQGHFAIYDHRPATELYADFLESAVVDVVPVIPAP